MTILSVIAVSTVCCCFTNELQIVAHQEASTCEHHHDAADMAQTEAASDCDCPQILSLTQEKISFDHMDLSMRLQPFSETIFWEAHLQKLEHSYFDSSPPEQAISLYIKNSILRI